MISTPQSAGVSKAAFWSGWAITGLVVLMLTFSASMKLSQAQPVLEEFARLGYASNAALAIGIVEIICAVIYLIPQTAVLGAILLTGYLGGAVATHVRISDPFYGPVIGGVLVWIGLYLREPRLRALAPWRSRA
ncbi:MAG: DoxX family protein [Pirellulales bacterium]